MWSQEMDKEWGDAWERCKSRQVGRYKQVKSGVGNDYIETGIEGKRERTA